MQKKKIKVGKKLDLNDLNFLRPAKTKNFNQLKNIIGKKTKRSFHKDQIIKFEI